MLFVLRVVPQNGDAARAPTPEIMYPLERLTDVQTLLGPEHGVDLRTEARVVKAHGERQLVTLERGNRWA